MGICERESGEQTGRRTPGPVQKPQGPLRRHNNTPVLTDGQNGDWTPHDRTEATMRQALGVSLDAYFRSISASHDQ
jgi:hypothetical protein